MTPTGRYWNDVSGLTAVPPPTSGVNVVDGTGMSSPRFAVSFLPSWPRSDGFAISFVVESLSRKRNTHCGTVR